MRNRPYSKWSRLSAELGRRKVYPVVAAYAVVAWVVLQIAEVTFEPMQLPDWAMRTLIVAAVLGFPAAVVLAWFFDVSLKGIRLDRGAVSKHSERPSVAVLPFTDMSEAGDQGYFCDGVAEEILNALNRVEQLDVAARSASFKFRNPGGDAQEIGAALGVDTVLEGSVRKSGERIRVTAQLVDVVRGFDVWSKSFDEELTDIFGIQDLIAGGIADSLLDTIASRARPRIRTTASKDVTAYDYYLRGRQFMNRFHRMDLEHGCQMFHQAIERDPDFALAWAGCADCYSLLVMYHDPKEHYCEQAREASQRALQLDPDSAEAHASCGLALMVSEDYEACEKHFARAIELNPRLFQAHYYFARARFHQGDLDQAARLFRRAADVDSGDFQSRCLRVQILSGLGRIDEAVEQAREVEPILIRHIEWNPDDARALHLGAGSMIVLGEFDRAKRWLGRALQMEPDDSVLLYNVACNYATMGELDDAIGFLERAVQSGMVSQAWMRNDDDLQALRGSPRYEALLRKLEE